MNLNEEQIEAATYIFEREYMSNKDLSEYELEVIAKSGLSEVEPIELESQIINHLESSDVNINNRIGFYWALGKCYERFHLITLFRKWLRMELENEEPIAVYQIMISLQNLEENVFHENRTGTAYYEYDLNIRNAIEYLNKRT